MVCIVANARGECASHVLSEVATLFGILHKCAYYNSASREATAPCFGVPSSSPIIRFTASYPPECMRERNPYSPLGGGIILNANKIGDNCTVSAGVIIGKKGTNENRPYIGDNVNFSIGSKAIGRIVIGNNVTVAPNSVVIKDVPDNCILSGVPARILKRDGQKVFSYDI